MRSSFVRILIFIILSAFTFTNCVSVNFKSPPPQKSEVVQFEVPDKSYEEVPAHQLDRSWRHKKSGATISFLSECQNPTDPSLENIFKGITSELNDVVVIDSHNVEYNARAALHAQVEGNVDGILSRFELMIFKKNNCTYILTYASAATAFADGQRDFLKFVKGFTVP